MDNILTYLEKLTRETAKPESEVMTLAIEELHRQVKE